MECMSFFVNPHALTASFVVYVVLRPFEGKRTTFASFLCTSVFIPQSADSYRFVDIVHDFH